MLEKAYVRDSITQAQYTPTCHRLLSQYKSILTNKSVVEQFVNLEFFLKAYNVCISPSKVEFIDNDEYALKRILSSLIKKKKKKCRF